MTPPGSTPSHRATRGSIAAALLTAALLLYGCAGSETSRTGSASAPEPSATAEDAIPARPDSQMAAAADSAAARPQPDTARADTARADTARADTARRTEAAENRPPADPDPAPDRPAPDRPATVDADSLQAFTEEGARLQDLFGEVFVRQDSTRLRSQFARRYLDRGEFLFTDNVVIFERGDTLTADTVRYDKNRKIGRARGNVRLTDGDVVVRAPRAVYYAQEKRSVFPDTVTLVDSTRVLRASTGTYFSSEDRAEFGGHVQMTDPNTYMEADSVTYLRTDQMSIARGNVFIERNPRRRRAAGADTTRRTFLFGERARNEETSNRSRVRGRALLVQIRSDSLGQPTDTLVVAAQEMDLTRRGRQRRVVATDSVRIWQADLAAVADSAVYDRFEAPPTPRQGPAVAPPPADSIRVRVLLPPLPALDAVIARITPPQLPGPGRGPESPPVVRTGPGPDSASPPAGARPTGAPPAANPSTAASPEASGDTVREESRLYREPMAWFADAQVRGDSLRVVARERSIDTVFVHGSAFVAEEDSASGRIHQLTGTTVTAFFRRDTLRQVVAEPNARAIRFLTKADGTGNGAARPSGDRIILRFRHGDLARVSILGGVQNEYYRPPDVPEPFRLEGFTWTPERKPTLPGLLDRPRVRARISPRSRPDTTAPLPADSVRAGTEPVADPPPRLGAADGRDRFPRPAAPRADTLGRPAAPRPADARRPGDSPPDAP